MIMLRVDSEGRNKGQEGRNRGLPARERSPGALSGGHINQGHSSGNIILAHHILEGGYSLLNWKPGGALPQGEAPGKAGWELESWEVESFTTLTGL